MKQVSLKERRRLKYAATLNDESLPETTSPDYELKYIDIGNVDSSGTVHKVATYRFENAPSRARRIVCNGDVIISTVRTYLKAIAPVINPPENLIVSTGFAVVRPRKEVLDAGFCKYVLREPRFLSEVVYRSVGVSYPAINSSELADIRIELPPIADQRRIAEYLEAETAQIDALILEKEAMLALLQEKRVAQISRAVTRGLDPIVSMKTSILDWLIEIPVHWNVMQLKRTWLSAEYGISENIRDEGAVKVLRMSCIVDGRIDLTNAGQVEEVPSHLVLHEGDILFNRTNSLDQVAKVGLLDVEPETPTSFASYLVRIRAKQDISREYLTLLLNSQEFLKYARCNAIPAISQANLSPSRYGDIRIPLPPRNEQEEIVAYLSSERARTAALEASMQRSLALLKERRSALITAAVTGQIEPEVMTA